MHRLSIVEILLFWGHGRRYPPPRDPRRPRRDGRCDLVSGAHVPPIDFLDDTRCPTWSPAATPTRSSRPAATLVRRPQRRSTSGSGSPEWRASRTRSPNSKAPKRAVAFATGMAALDRVPDRTGHRRQAAHGRGAPALRRHRPRARDRPARHQRHLGDAPTRSPPRSGPTPAWSSSRRPPTRRSSSSTSREVVAAAGDVPVLVDNTFATPVLQQPARHGATLVLHSATKYLGGHGDVMGGVVATNDEWAQRLRQVRALTGGLLHPMAAYLLHRGLRTLPLRVRAQQETGAGARRAHQRARRRRAGALPGPARPGPAGAARPPDRRHRARSSRSNSPAATTPPRGSPRRAS